MTTRPRATSRRKRETFAETLKVVIAKREAELAILNAEHERLRNVLERLLGWDMFNPPDHPSALADAKYWVSEIKAALAPSQEPK